MRRRADGCHVSNDATAEITAPTRWNRPEEDHDPVDHVVARIVAPRKESDAPGYDQPEWVLQALSDLLGVP